MAQVYSKLAADFACEVEKFSKSKLKRKAELIRLYEEALKYRKEKLFEELVFTAKYVQGLMRAVQAGTYSSEISNIEQIKRDFSDNLNKVVVQIKEIIVSAGDEMKSHFENTYFELTQQGFLNLSELLNDLEWSKMYINERKRKEKH